MCLACVVFESLFNLACLPLPLCSLVLKLGFKSHHHFVATDFVWPIQVIRTQWWGNAQGIIGFSTGTFLECFLALLLLFHIGFALRLRIWSMAVRGLSFWVCLLIFSPWEYFGQTLKQHYLLFWNRIITWFPIWFHRLLTEHFLRLKTKKRLCDSKDYRILKFEINHVTSFGICSFGCHESTWV